MLFRTRPQIIGVTASMGTDSKSNSTFAVLWTNAWVG